MFVRTAGERDLPAVIALLAETWHATYDSYCGREEVEAILSKWHTLSSLRANLERDRSEFLLADDGETIAGMAYAAALDDDAQVVMLRQIYVRPGLQGRGIGGMLLQEIEESFFESELMRVEVEDRNARAIAFYRALGYLPAGTRHIGATHLAVFEKSLLPDA